MYSDIVKYQPKTFKEADAYRAALAMLGAFKKTMPREHQSVAVVRHVLEKVEELAVARACLDLEALFDQLDEGVEDKL